MADAVDMINHPPHYAGARWESIEIIEALGNQFRLGNALKYIFRHKKKGGDEDLKKARWYLELSSDRSIPPNPTPSIFPSGAPMAPSSLTASALPTRI